MKYFDFLILDTKRRLMDLKNYSFVSTHKRNSFNLYSQFLESGDLCFDVGANMGNRIDSFLKIGAKVVAVEPQPKCNEYLERKFPSIQIEKVGAAEKVGKAMLNISSADVLSTFSTDWINTVKETRFKEYTWSTQLEVSLITLDLLIEKHGLPKFCKVDVEGFELSVFGGLTQPIPGISFEYTVPEATETMAACIRRLLEISPNYKFNYAIGESMILQKKDFLTGEEMLEHLYSPEFQNTSWGDIYAKIF